MSGANQDTGVRQAADELQRYLSDEIAPMMAVEYFEQLMPHPPEITAKIIAHWVQAQHHKPGERVTSADLIYHALKKLSLLSELELVRRATMMRSIHEVSRLLVQVCPAGQRDELRLRLSHLGETTTVLSSRAEFLHREAGLGGGPAPEGGAAAPAAQQQSPKEVAQAKPDADSIDRGARALGMLLDGLAKLHDPKAKEAPKEGPEAALLAQILSTAALESKTNEDLAQHLERIKKEGVATPMGQVFRALGWSLPGWGTIGEEGKGDVDPRAGRQLKAMDRIVALAPDAQERAKRWGEMIYAAIEQLNEGRLAQAVSILEVAKRLITERRPDPEIVAQVFQQAETAISEDLLRRLADVPTKHGLLRKVLEFFPSLRPDMLLSHLDGEIRREKRKLILTLLEVHGPICRDAILSRLASVMRHEMPDPDGFYRRNLAFLLRRIPRTAHERLEEELALLTAMVDPLEPPISAKEAVMALGQVRHSDAEMALIDRLRSLEAEMISRGGSRDSWELADRICAALARHGSPRAIRAIASHACNRAPALGDALTRFEHLSRLDLTVDPEQLAVLLKAIRDLAPAKVLGFVPKKGHHDLACMMNAIAGTPAQEVRAVLQGIAEKFKNHALGEQARSVLAKLEPKARVTPDALTGDLELFGLPNLMQTLAGSGSSGELVLFDTQQARQGAIVLTKGKITRADHGTLAGAEAIYTFMEKPFPGSFAFRAVADDREVSSDTALDAMSVLLEGARRHDEYQQARAFAADGVRYEPAGIPAIRHPDENDGELATAVWDRAAAGTPADLCEKEVKADPYRVRRLYAYWVESRALRPRA
ncbi:MAG TPA: DUF4388 domain-containing protein [Candidatus Polarisedimenticolaceae bacterium]|nr:DUF4388 domain-containing protein [Candidatus Polarisedimenticolaceae bacterium]